MTDERKRGPFEQVWWERVQSGAHFSAEGDELWRLRNKATAERVARMKERKQKDGEDDAPE